MFESEKWYTRNSELENKFLTHYFYAVLVSMLEKYNDYYNAGIVDVSYKYEKIYVIRP